MCLVSPTVGTYKKGTLVYDKWRDSIRLILGQMPPFPMTLLESCSGPEFFISKHH